MPAIRAELRPSGSRAILRRRVHNRAVQRPEAEAKQQPETPLQFSLTLPDAANLSPEDQAEALRRYRIIEPVVQPERFELLWLENKRHKNLVVEHLARESQVSRRTLYAWLKAWSQHGLPGLVRKDRCDKGFSRSLNRAALDFILAAALPRPGAYGELSVREIYRAYQEERAWRASHATKRLAEFEIQKYARYIDLETGALSAAAQLPEASYETFRYWYGRIPEAIKVLARQGEDRFRCSQEVLSFRDLAAIDPLDYLVMDHRRLDLFCMARSKDGWKLVRPWLTAAIDMRTRRWLGWGIVETPSSDSIASVMKRVFLEFGVPKAVYWDNGRDFTCEWLEGSHARRGSSYRIEKLGDGISGVLDTLGIRVHHAIVKRARSKLIEPAFIATANFDRSTPWWCGHRPDTRPERFNALTVQHEGWINGKVANPPFPTISEVAALYDDFLESLNEREHTGEGMRKIAATGYGWMCPNECWERLIGRVEQRLVSPEVLQFAFQKRRKLTVRNAEVRASFGGRQYHYRLVENPIGLMAFNGREVEFAYDPFDLGSAALYFEGRFLGLATNVELRRMGEADFVQDERDRRAARREVKKFIGLVHKQIHVPGPVERLARRPVRPPRNEAARVEIPVSVPPAVLEASQAAQRDKQFSFAAANGADMIRVADALAYRDDDPDDGFQFFGKG